MERSALRWLHAGRRRKASDASARRDRAAPERLPARPRLRRHRPDHRAAALPPRGRARRPARREARPRRSAPGCSPRSTSAATRGRTRRSTSCSTATSTCWRSRTRPAPATRASLRNYIRPLLGRLSIARIDGETLDSFYAELRRCRARCNRRPRIDHRTSGRARVRSTLRAARLQAARGVLPPPDPHPPQRSVRPRRPLALARDEPGAAGRRTDAASTGARPADP